MGFEYWDHEPFVIDLNGDRQIGVKYWKLVTPGLFGAFSTTWGKESLRLYKKVYLYPGLSKSDNLLSKETKDMFNAQKIVIRGVGKGISSFHDKDGVATLVGVHSIVEPKYPNFYLSLFNSLLVDWIYSTKYLGGKIPQGSMKYPVSFLKEIPIQEKGIRKLESEIRSLSKSPRDRLANRLKIESLILSHYGVAEEFWAEMEGKVLESVQRERLFTASGHSEEGGSAA